MNYLRMSCEEQEVGGQTTDRRRYVVPHLYTGIHIYRPLRLYVVAWLRICTDQNI